MNAEEFDKLVNINQPNTNFHSDWAGFASWDFANTLLPNARKRSTNSMHVYDGINLFEGTSEKDVELDLGNDKKPINIISYIYPKGVTAGDKKDKIRAGEYELLAFMELEQSENLNIKFKFGNKFKSLIEEAFKSEGKKVHVSRLENQEYISSISGIRSDIGGILSQSALMSFALSNMGLKNVGSHNLASLFGNFLNNINSKNPKLPPPALSYFNAALPPPFNSGDTKTKDGWTHGKIERVALQNILSEDEIYQVYIGNWLRDYSQIIDPLTIGLTPLEQEELRKTSYPVSQIERMNLLLQPSTWLEIIKLMGVKEFIYDKSPEKEKLPSKYSDLQALFDSKYGKITRDTLGLYRPEEHIDNPKGLGKKRELDKFVFYTYEKPTLNKEANKVSVEKYDLSFYPGEIPKATDINYNSSPGPYIKPYILSDFEDRPSAFTYFTDQMLLSFHKKSDKLAKLRHYGAAMHVLEDYFAHSNFVEISLIKNGWGKVHPWVQLSKEVQSITNLKDRAKKIPIVTGRFSGDDTAASIAPKLSDHFDPSKEVYTLRKAGERTFSQMLVTYILEDIAMKQATLPDTKKFTVGGFTIIDVLKFWKELLKKEDVVLTSANSDSWDAPAWRTAHKAFYYTGFAFSYFFNIALSILLGMTDNAIKNLQTAVSNNNYGDNPSHTQLAKDDLEHPLNPLAGELAVRAVRDISLLMQMVWTDKRKIADVLDYAKKTYFVHPCDTTWMDDFVLQWGKSNPDALSDSEKPILEDLNKDANDLKNSIKKAIDQYNNGSMDIIDFIKKYILDNLNPFK